MVHRAQYWDGNSLISVFYAQCAGSVEMKYRNAAANKTSRESNPDLSNLVRVLAKVRNAGEMQEFLGGLLTPKERARIALRWELVKLLERGASQRDIARMLRVSLCKITRGSRELRVGPEGFRRIVWAGLKLDGHKRGMRKRPGRPRKNAQD